MSVTHSFHSAAFELRRISWSQLAGYAYLGFFILLLVRLAAPEAMGPALRTLAFALPLVLLVAKDLAHLPDALQRLRGATGWRGRILALLPPELIGMARLDRLMWIGCLQWLRRRKPLARPEGRWHVAEGSHVLADGMLHLRVGVRTQGSIPLSSIERVDAVTEAPERWRRRHGIHPADTITVTPFDKPNCVLVMKPDAGVTLLHWQVRRAAPRYVLLYLDRPELLASSVKQDG